MAAFSVRVPGDLAARFDAAAAPAGGRSAMLRRLIAGAAGPATTQTVAAREVRDALRVMVRLAAPEARALDAEAAASGMTRSGWLAALARRRLLGVPVFARADAIVLIAAQGELRRIGVNVNQIARALNTAVMEGRVLDLEMASLEDFRREIRGHLWGLREALAGNLAYWDVDP